MAFITTTVNKWTPVFENEQCALLLLDQLQETLKHYRVSLTAYVLMPHHIHLLLGFQKIEEMSLVMQHFKRMSSRRLKPLIPSDYAKELDYAGQFRLWQPRFDDVIIWSEKQFKIKIEYIHNNPVKAGLAKTATDYFYSSARDWLSDQKGILPVDRKWTWLKEN